MAETEGDRSIWRLLADEHAFFAELAKSEKLADELVRSFLEEGEIDRDGRVRYRVWQIRALPGGAPSPYDGAFWQSAPERGVRCEIDHRNSSAHWTGPASAEWKASGRKTAEYQAMMIRLNHLVVLDFLMGVGLLPLPEQSASEPAMEPAAAPVANTAARTAPTPAEMLKSLRPGTMRYWVLHKMMESPSQIWDRDLAEKLAELCPIGDAAPEEKQKTIQTCLGEFRKLFGARPKKS